jgi:hypothetical protein
MIRPMRWLRLLGFARGPLSRRSDRAQKLLFTGAVVAACFAIPIASSMADTAAAGQEPADGYQTSAVLKQDAPAPLSYSEYGPIEGIRADATWQAPNGSPRSGTIDVEPGVKAGQQVTIWTDASGTPLADFQPPAQAQMRVFLAGLWAGAGWLLGVVVMYLVLAWVLRRRRIEAWADEWERADRDWRQAT